LEEWEKGSIFEGKENKLNLKLIKMNVLSLFDGMSCGQIALKQVGIVPDIYYASEIDKFAIAQTELNFPATVKLGSVIDVDVSKLERIDMLIGGSPCQSFSFAGKRDGMATEENEEIYTLERYMELRDSGFKFKGYSYLFWEYMRILTDIRKYNPDVLFLLENVEMGKKWEGVLTDAIGVAGIHINSALVSAQNRKRIYWTNIQGITKPEDRGILLRDILEDGVGEKYYLKPSVVTNMNAWAERNAGNGNGFKMEIRDGDEKSTSIPTGSMKSSSTFVEATCCSMVGRKIDENGTRKDYDANIETVQRIEVGSVEKTNCITSVQKDNLLIVPEAIEYTDSEKQDIQDQINSVSSRDVEFSYATNGNIRPHRSDYKKSGISEVGTVIHPDNKCVAIIKSHEPKTIELNKRQLANFVNLDEKTNSFLSTSWKGSQANGMTNLADVATARIRRLTPTECARLQTVPSWYKWGCSDTQQYKMLGNGWTVDVIAHIFKNISL